MIEGDSRWVSSGQQATPRRAQPPRELAMAFVAFVIVSCGIAASGVMTFQTASMQVDERMREPARTELIESLVRSRVEGVVLIAIALVAVAIALLALQGFAWARVAATVVGVVVTGGLCYAAVGAVFAPFGVVLLPALVFLAGCAIASIVLMLRPASNRYFRARAAERAARREG